MNISTTVCDDLGGRTLYTIGAAAAVADASHQRTLSLRVAPSLRSIVEIVMNMSAARVPWFQIDKETVEYAEFALRTSAQWAEEIPSDEPDG